MKNWLDYLDNSPYYSAQNGEQIEENNNLPKKIIPTAAQLKTVQDQVNFNNDWMSRRVINGVPINVKTRAIYPETTVDMEDLNTDKTKSGTTWGQYNPYEDLVTLDPRFEERPGIPAHEFMHQIQNKFLGEDREKYLKLIYDPITEVTDRTETYRPYDKDYQEVQARLQQIRWDKKFQPDQIIKEEDLEDVILDRYDLRDYDKKDILHLLNSVVDNSTIDKNFTVAQEGLTTGASQMPNILGNRPSIQDLINESKQRKNTPTKPVPQTSKDNTRVKISNKGERFSKTARNKTDKEIAQERKAKIDESEKYQDVPFTQDNWREVLAKQTQATGDKFRVSDEPNFFDDYVNPGVWLGSMASNLGQAPLQAQQSDSVLPYVTSVGMPLVAGAFGGLGAKNAGQFVNNLANPLAGFNLKNNALGVYNLGKLALKNPELAAKKTVNNLKLATKTPRNFSVENLAQPAVSKPWKIKELPGLHLQSTMENGSISKIIEPKTGLINIEQALSIIGKESGGANKVAIIKKGLGENIPKKMDYNDFRKTVQDQLIPLERQFSTERSDYGLQDIGYVDRKVVNGVTIDTTSPDLLENQTLILGNRSKFGRGSSAHGNPEETLGHIHFLKDAETPDVLTVTQIQSDAFQGTHRIMPKTQQEALEKVSKLKEEGREIKSMFGDGKKSSNAVLANYEKHLQLAEASAKNFTQKQLLDKNHQERYLQEFVNYAGKRGDINKLRLPTSETAAKVQGYSKNTATGMDEMGLPTDLGYSSEHQTILKKYSEQPKTIKKLFGVEPKVVTDSKGNTWYEFDIPEKFKQGKGEVKAFATTGLVAGTATALSQYDNSNNENIKQNGGWLDNFDIAQNGYTTGDQVVYGTPEYEEAYKRGEVITDEGVHSPIELDEVVVKNNYKRNWAEQYAEKIRQDNKDAGVLGAAVGVPISAVANLPQMLGMKLLSDKFQSPSEEWGFKPEEDDSTVTKYSKIAGNFLMDALTDPVDLIPGAAALRASKASKLLDLKPIIKAGNAVKSLTLDDLNKVHKFPDSFGIKNSIQSGVNKVKEFGKDSYEALTVKDKKYLDEYDKLGKKSAELITSPEYIESYKATHSKESILLQEFNKYLNKLNSRNPEERLELSNKLENLIEKIDKSSQFVKEGDELVTRTKIDLGLREGNTQIVDLETGISHPIKVSHPKTGTKYSVDNNTLKKEDFLEEDFFVDEKYKEIIKKNIDFIKRKVPGADIFGSARGVLDLDMPHIIGDYDLIISKQDYDKFAKNNQVIGGNDMTKKHRIKGANNTEEILEINVIDEGSNGKAQGQLAKELFRQADPEGFHVAMKKSISSGKDLEIPYSSRELLGMTNTTTKTVVDAYEAVKNPKNYLKIDAFINYGKPSIVLEGQKQYIRGLVGDKGSVGHQFKLSELSDVEENLKILDKIGFLGDKTIVSKNPERMQVALNDYYIRRSTLVREVDKTKDLKKLKSSLAKYKPEAGGGDVNGIGQNHITIGDVNWRPITGVKQIHLEKDISSPSNYIKSIDHQTLGSEIFTKEEVDILHEIVGKIKDKASINEEYVLRSKNSSELIERLPYSNQGKDILYEFSEKTGKKMATKDYTFGRAGNSGYYTSTLRDLDEAIDALKYFDKEQLDITKSLKSFDTRKTAFENSNGAKARQFIESVNDFKTIEGYVKGGIERAKARKEMISQELEGLNKSIKERALKMAKKSSSRFDNPEYVEELKKKRKELLDSYNELHRLQFGLINRIEKLERIRKGYKEYTALTLGAGSLVGVGAAMYNDIIPTPFEVINELTRGQTSDESVMEKAIRYKIRLKKQGKSDEEIKQKMDNFHKRWNEITKKHPIETKQNGGWLDDLDNFQNGGIIDDDMGQWKYPGKVTRINSNQITMQGVPYPVLGVSDTGDTQIMYPNGEYKYRGNNVTEFPLAQEGKSINGKKKSGGLGIEDWWYNRDDVQQSYKMANDIDPFVKNWMNNPITQKKLNEQIGFHFKNGETPIDVVNRNLNSLPVYYTDKMKGISNSDFINNHILQNNKGSDLSYYNLENRFNKLRENKYYIPGKYLPEIHSISINDPKDFTTLSHEITHGSGIQNKLDHYIDMEYNEKERNNYSENSIEKDRQEYLDRDGVYPRIMEIRRALNLKPGQKVDRRIFNGNNKNLLNAIDDLKSKYEDDEIIKILNTVAYNNIAPDQFSIAQNGETLPNTLYNSEMNDKSKFDQQKSWLYNWMSHPEYINRLSKNLREVDNTQKSSYIDYLNSVFRDDEYYKNFAKNTANKSKSKMLRTKVFTPSNSANTIDFKDKFIEETPGNKDQKDNTGYMLYTSSGFYDPNNTKRLFLQKDADPSTAVHEFTHATGIDNIMSYLTTDGKKILDENERLKKKFNVRDIRMGLGKPYGKVDSFLPDILESRFVKINPDEFEISPEMRSYINKSNEIYPRIMSLRYNGNVKPGQIIDKKSFEKIKEASKDDKIFEIYDDDQIIYMMNKFANNDSTPSIYSNNNKIAQNGYTTGNQVTYGTPEYEEAYRRGEVVSEDGTHSPIELDEVIIQNNYKNKLKDEREGAINKAISTKVAGVNFDDFVEKIRKTNLQEKFRRGALSQEEREREDYNNYNSRHGSIRQHVPQSTASKLKAIALNPLTAFGYAARNESLPDNFQFGERNALDYAIDVINPFSYVDDVGNLIKNTAQGSSELMKGNFSNASSDFANAGLNALSLAPLGLEANNILEGARNAYTKKFIPGKNKQVLPNSVSYDITHSPKGAEIKLVGDDGKEVGFLGLNQHRMPVLDANGNVLREPNTHIPVYEDSEWYEPYWIDVIEELQGNRTQDVLYQLGIEVAKLNNKKGIYSGKTLISPGKTKKAHERFDREFFKKGVSHTDDNTFETVVHDIVGLTGHKNPNVVEDWFKNYQNINKFKREKLSIEDLSKKFMEYVKKIEIQDPSLHKNSFIDMKGILQKYPKGDLTPEEITSFRNSDFYKHHSNEHLESLEKYGDNWKLNNFVEDDIINNNRNTINPILYGGNNWSPVDYGIATAMLSAYPTALGLYGLAATPPAVKNKVLNKAGIDMRDKNFLRDRDTIIDLTNRNMDFAKVNETTDGKIILGGEFIEDSNNTVRKAKEWINAKDTYSDKKYPSKDIQAFYGIENERFKTGKAEDFDPDTEIVPRRFGEASIQKAVLNGNQMRLLDKEGKPIYQNTPNTGKFILYSPSTKKSEFIYINSGKKGVDVVNNFLKKNKDAQYIHLDNGRYEYYGVNPKGLSDYDFEKYYEQDLKREGNPGYNLILSK